MRPLPLAPLALILVCLLGTLAQAAQTLAAGPKAYPVLDRKPPPAQTELRLTQRERAVFPALAATEDSVRALAGQFDAQSTRLAAIRAESDRLLAERAAAEMEILALAARLRGMLPEMWALSIGVESSMDSSATPWDEADRRLHWLGAAYARGREELSALQQKSAQLAGNVSRQEELKAETASQQTRLEKLKDTLAAETLRLARDLSAARQEARPENREIDRVMDVLSRFDFRPPYCDDRPLNQAKGALPWPAEGRLAQAFNPEASPPVLGVGLATAPNATVRAVYWGKVVYVETLRSLGKVVIVSHGQQAFSVYARLSRALVRPGQDVSQGEALGQAGWLPAAAGAGCSFELRFREKPINPGGWLAASG